MVEALQMMYFLSRRMAAFADPLTDARWLPSARRPLGLHQR
jgi:hypothetical protein